MSSGARRAQLPKVVVDGDRCRGCGCCAAACAEQAISVTFIAIVDPARCTCCGNCVLACPDEALSLARLPLARGAAG